MLVFAMAVATLQLVFPAVLLGSLAFAASNAAQPSAYELVIIGSGMAGLGAARRASQLGVKNVLILEARDRIGGRTFTQALSIKFSQNSMTTAAIDIGAAWIHGSTNPARGLNPMSKLANDARPAGSTAPGYLEVVETGLSFDPQGKEDADAWDAAYVEMLGRWQTYYNKYTYGKTNDADSVQTVYNKFISSQKPALTKLQKDALAQAVMTEIVMEYAADLSQMSGPYGEEDLNWGGPNALPARGYGALVSYLASSLSAPVWLSYAVDVIDYSKAATATGGLVNVSGRILQSGAGAGSFSVQAQYVINTMPLGYLQAQLSKVSRPSLFNPKLSGPQTIAIQSLGMGLLNKVILAWNSSWWSGALKTPWIAIRNNATVGAYSEFYNLDATPAKLPVLICFNAGSFAKSEEAIKDDATIVARALAPLQKLLPAGKNVPPPAQTIVTRWGSDPWTYGSYSYGKVGMKETARATAFTAVGSGRVGFAGEHTHVSYPATVHGAYLSGIREAERVAKLLGLAVS